MDELRIRRKKNLIIEDDDEQKIDILKQGSKKGIISTDIADKNKKVDKAILINKQTVKTGLKDEDAENFGEIADADRYKADTYTFENLPAKRLAREQEIMNNEMPRFKGCKKKAAKARWKSKQQARIDKAAALKEKHERLLQEYNNFKAEQLDRVEYLRTKVSANIIAKNKKNTEADQPKITAPEMLDEINGTLVTEVFGHLQTAVPDKRFQDKIESFFSKYVIDDNREEERLKAQEKDKKKRQKKAAKTGQEEPNEDLIVEREEVENELLHKDNDHEAKLSSKVQDLDGHNTVDLGDMAKLFNRVLKNSEKPYTENKYETFTETVIDKVRDDKGNIIGEQERQVESKRVVSTRDLSRSRYEETVNDAKTVLTYAKNLGIAVPEELYCILDIKDNNLFVTNNKAKFAPDAHVAEAYVLLMSATAKVFYSALNRFAGYYASDGIKTMYKSEDLERKARNFDVFNVEMMTHVRNIRDRVDAYAAEIRRNRLDINDSNLSEEAKEDRNLRENIMILQGVQPTGVAQEKKVEVPKEDNKEEQKKQDKKKLEEEKKKKEEEEKKKQEKIYEEWRTLLKKDIRGTEEVDHKDMKKSKWVLKDYADKVFELMKSIPECKNLTGEPLKRYLITLNGNLNHNLLQLTDELPKSSIGKKFLYIPKMKEDFIEQVKEQKFALMLRSDTFFRDLLNNNAYLDDFFSKPKYVAAKNRQIEIMKSINTALGTKLYTNLIHLSDLWANETIQALLLSEPLDKAEQEKLAEEEIEKEAAKKEGDQQQEGDQQKGDQQKDDQQKDGQQKDDQKKDEQKKKPAKEDGALRAQINRILSKSKTYGVTDQAFQDTLTKIRANVHDNVAVIDRKIDLMGICNTAKDVLKRNILKDLGGEYLLGYSIIAQDIVEYTIDNMMVYDGSAAAIQRTWERKFARTGLPTRLSSKIEKVVAAHVNANGHRDRYYLRPKMFNVSKEKQVKWEESNQKVNDIISSLKTLYKKNIKDFLKNYVASPELRKSIQNTGALYVNDEVRLTKDQWDKIEVFFENYWLEIFENNYANGTYDAKSVSDKLDLMKTKLSQIFDEQLQDNFKKREALKGDNAALSDFLSSLMNRAQFTGGFEKNAAIKVPPKSVVDSDIQKQIFGDPALKKIFKRQEEKDIFNQVLAEQLDDEKSALHTTHPYLADVKSVEQLGDLSLIDYSQFFADLKALLSVTGVPHEANAQPRLLLDEWRLCGQAGGDMYGIRRKLLADFFAGGMDDQVFATKLAQYRTEALKAQEIDRMRFDAILSSDGADTDSALKFDYLSVIGQKIKQPERIKRMGYAHKLWDRLQNYKIGAGTRAGDSFANLIKAFIQYMAIATDKNNPNKDKIAAKQEILKFGKILDNMKITEVVKQGEPVSYSIDDKSIAALRKSGCLQGYILTSDDMQMLLTVKNVFAEIALEDSSKKKQTISDCMGEILLLGYEKEYFEAGGRGEEALLDSNDDAYYNTIIKKSNDFYIRRAQITPVINQLNITPEEKEKLHIRLKPIIAGIKDRKSDAAKNISKFGVSDTHDMIVRILELYGDNQKSRDMLAKSKMLGEIYKARCEIIDNYGTGAEKGKFKIVRDIMMRDHDVWKKVMTLTDDEFIDFMKDQDRRYGLGLKMFMSSDYVASQPINEQYIMRNWKDFQSREAWTERNWKDTIDSYYDTFMNVRIGDKSVNQIFDAVEKKMEKNGINGTALMNLTFLLKGDVGAFNLLYNENDMYEAITRLDSTYKGNITAFDDYIGDITAKQFKKQKTADTKEDEELLKEIVNIVNLGKMAEMNKKALGSAGVIYKMDDEARKGKELTEADKAYADYNLLMQIIKPYAFSVTTDKFKAGLLEKFKEFKGAQQLERNSNIYSDRSVLETKDVVRLELEIKKNQGRMLERDLFKEFTDYAMKKATLGSVGLVAYNADPKLSKKDFDAAKKFVDENIAGDFGNADEAFIRGLLTERAAAFGLKDEEALKAALKSEKLRLLNLDKALRADKTFVLEEDIKKAIVFAFAQNASRVSLPLDGTHEGDVKEIIDGLNERQDALFVDKPVSRIAQRDYEEFTEEMDIARFTMPKEQFMQLCDYKRRYYELVDACVEKIGEVSKDLKIQVGLFDYFRKDIYEAVKAETGKEDFVKSVSDQIDKLIGSKVEGRRDLTAEDIKQITLAYLPDSSVLMQQISNKTITAEERLFSSEKFTRADVEREILLSGKKDLIKQYNDLTVEEQKVFAIALTFPDIGVTEKEQLTSNEALRDHDKEYQRELELQESLATYIYDKDFQPRIDYNLVMRRLMKTDAKTGFRRVSVTMFEKAMKYTLFCIDKKNEMRPKDFTKLSDGSMSGDLGRQYEGKNAENEAVKACLEGNITKLFEGKLKNLNEGERSAAEGNLKKMRFFGANSFRKYFMKISEVDLEKNSGIKNIVKRFEKYNTTQMYMLLHVLQDRTVVDYTTFQGRYSGFSLERQRFVNEERREAIRNSFTRPDGMDKEFIAELSRSMKNDMYEKAAETLFSYQLRDDVDLTNKAVTAGDFAKDVLKRNTMIDWEMLKRAMDFMEEIEKENKTIQLCRQTTQHTTDDSSPNEKARALGKEIEAKMKEPTTNHMDYFHDFIVREAKKNPNVGMPLVSAYAGLSENEKMLLIHSLVNRDILDISKNNVFTTAIGMNENRYVNEMGRDRLADYYIDHLSVPGAKNILATSQYEIRGAMRSLVSTQVDDSKNERSKKEFADMMEGTKLFNWIYIGFDTRSTGVDWKLFGNALKFVKRTEEERKLLIGNSETYRATGDISKYGRFMYNYRFMRKNLYRSGNRFTRFVGRRIRAEIEGAIPGYGMGQKLLMACLSPEMRNKMLGSGIVKPAPVSANKNAVTDAIGYAGLGGTAVSGAASALKMVQVAASAGMAVAGEGIYQASSALAGVYNLARNYRTYKSFGAPLENEEDLKKESEKKQKEGQKFQTEEQKIATADNKINKDWILNEVATVAGKGAISRDMQETLTNCINVISGSSFGVQALTNVFVGGIRAGIAETFHTIRFISSVCYDKSMMDKYFADEGPLGEEIKNLKSGNFQKIIDDQNHRKNTGTRDILTDADLTKAETNFIGNMSNRELFMKAYGFKDFTELASYVGWHIVQTLLQSASPFATDPAQFIKASLILSGIGCKDCIGKQDNDSAQKVYNRLMGTDIR